MARSSKQSTSSGSRREFLKTSGAAVAGSALVGGLASRSFAGGDEKMRIGLIGCGGRGTGACSQALHTEGDVELVAMADAFSDRLESSLNELQKDGAIASRINVPENRRFTGFDAYQKVLDSDIDLVVIATPPGFRPIHFEAAVDKQIHVFMEKPVAVDAPGVRRVLAAAKKAKEYKLGVGVGLQRHHQNLYLETIDRIHDGAIGDVVSARAYWNGAGVWVRPRKEGQTDMEYQMRNWYYFNWLCGDHIVEQHIHNLDVINWVKNGYPVRCQGMGGREVRNGKDHGEIFDHHAVEYEYADGSRMFSYCRHIPGCWSSVSEHVQGTKGHSDIHRGQIQVNGEPSWRFRGEKNNPYQTEHDNLFASIRSGNIYNEAENGAKSSLTAIMGRMATYSGKMVEWDDAMNSTIDLSPAEYAFDSAPPEPIVAIPGQSTTV